MGRILLDTNVLIRYFKDDEPFADAIERAEMVIIHPVVYAEYVCGLDETTKSGKILRKQIEDFLDAPAVALGTVTTATSNYYARIYRHLKRTGKMIPQNDIWLAASAFENGYELATHDIHFRNIPMLNLMQID